jgi:hypothetical protein
MSEGGTRTAAAAASNGNMANREEKEKFLRDSPKVEIIAKSEGGGGGGGGGGSGSGRGGSGG